MIKEPLRDYYLSLIPNLIADFFFFIPKNKISPDIIDKVDFLKNKQVYKKVFLIDYYEGFMEYIKGNSSGYFIIKQNNLEKNIFSLLEKKSEVASYEFEFVLEKYFELAECLFFITNWMNTHIARIGFYDADAWKIFRLQELNYKKHFEMLVKNFYPSREIVPKGNFNTLELIDKYFPDIKGLFDEQKRKPDLTKDTKEEDKNENKITLSNRKKAKKEALISEGEAEELMLKSIFNLDVNRIK